VYQYVVLIPAFEITPGIIVTVPYMMFLVLFGALQKKTKQLDEADNLKLLLHNLDLSYRLHWVGGKTTKLTRHGQELGTFQL
jgi:hypothetical protein